MTVDPTGPAGALVSAYTTSASDTTSPPATVLCTPPAPRTFAIGTRSVSCKATDQAGKSTTKTFTVRVRTAVELVAILKGMVTGASPPVGGVLVPILGALLDFAASYLNWSPPKPASACRKLNEFTDRIAYEMTKRKPGMTAKQAKSLTDYGNTIKSVIPC